MQTPRGGPRVHRGGDTEVWAEVLLSVNPLQQDEVRIVHLYFPP